MHLGPWRRGYGDVIANANGLDSMKNAASKALATQKKRRKILNVDLIPKMLVRNKL